MAPTPNYSFVLPTVEASDDTWGDTLNGNWTLLDTTLFALSGTVDERLPLAGGTVTGQIKLAADPVDDDDLTRKRYVDERVEERLLPENGDNRYLSLSGGTVTGHITRSADPQSQDHLTRKKYVDDSLANYGDNRYVRKTDKIDSSQFEEGSSETDWVLRQLADAAQPRSGMPYFLRWGGGNLTVGDIVTASGGNLRYSNADGDEGDPVPSGRKFMCMGSTGTSDSSSRSTLFWRID